MNTIRRFEFTDAKSSKFWEIHVAGDETVTTWGRLGTDGQTKAKAFASNAKAEADMAKKIAEKIKKGYTEVDALAPASPPAPAAAPATRPAATPASSPQLEAALAEARPGDNPFDVEPIPEPAHPGVVMPAAWKKYVQPMRGHDGHAAPLGATDATGGRELVTIRDKYLKRRKTGGATDAITTQSHRLAQGDWREPTDFGPVIDDLVERAGLATAVEIFENIYEPASGQRAQRAIGFFHEASMKTRLRQHIAAAADGDWHEARSRALELSRRDGPAAARMAGLFAGDTGLLATAISSATGTSWWYTRSDLFNAVATVADLDHVLTVVQRHPSHNFYSSRPLPTLLDRLGTDITRFVSPWLHGYGSGPVSTPQDVDADAAKAFGTLLVALGTDEAIALLADHADNKHIAASLSSAAQDRPHAAVRVLSSRINGRGRGDALCSRVLEQVAQEQPGVVRAELDRLDPTAQRRLRELGAAKVTALDAPLTRIPKLLADPPWTNRSNTAPAVVEVQPFNRPVRIDVDALPQAIQSSKTPDQWRDFVRDLVARGGGWPGSFFAEAPVDLVLDTLDEHPIGDLCLHQYMANWNLRQLVDRCGPRALPVLIRQATTNLGHLFDQLVRFDAVEVAPLVASALSYKSLRKDARSWLIAHPETAAVGLVPPAVGPTGKERLAAGSGLRIIAAHDRALVERIADDYGVEARLAVEQHLEDEGMAQLPKRMPKLPDFLRLSSAPRPLLVDADLALPVEATANLASMLQISSLADPYVGVELVAETLDPPSASAWAWALYEAWDLEGKPSKHSWVLDAQGLLGDDDTVRKLTPLIRAWPGEGGHKRAVAGLDALAAIGSEFALMQIYSISRKVKFKGIKARARDKVEEIAQELGLTGEELADRLVPDFDLDEHGSMTLDYGPRSFTVGFDQELKPFVKDETGKIRKALPNPGVKDDPDLAPDAKKQFAQLKKDVRAIAADNLLRLEMAMCTERRWSVADFRHYFLDHPLIVHLARRLVWATYGDDGIIADSFRVAEDGSLATAQDDTFILAPEATVGIPHPLHLDPTVAAAWGETFADYELLQPFDQLARESYEMTDQETAAEKFMRFSDGQRHPIGRFLGLGKFGWERGQPQDAGIVADMIKRIDATTALHLNMDGGIWTGMVAESEDTAILDVQIGDGVTWRTGGRTFSELSPIVRSELIRDLTHAFPASA